MSDKGHPGAPGSPPGPSDGGREAPGPGEKGEAPTRSPWNTIHSSKDMNWRTPPILFQQLDDEFDFKLDAAASPENALCPDFLHESDNALEVEWTTKTDGAVFLNPPYGRDVKRWVEKAYRESSKGLTVVILVMACTETQWWRQYVWKADEVRLVQGRVQFLDCNGKPRAAAPKGSAVIVFRPHWEGPPRVTLMEQRRRE